MKKEEFENEAEYHLEDDEWAIVNRVYTSFDRWPTTEDFAIWFNKYNGVESCRVMAGILDQANEYRRLAAEYIAKAVEIEMTYGC